MNSRKIVFIAALAIGTALAAGVAQARDRNDVQWSITLGAPIGVPFYPQSRPVYQQPSPVYPQRIYPQRIYPQRLYPQRLYPTHAYQQPTRWDRDGDGISNRRDPVFNPRWDRDGDGIPNRYDRRDQLRGGRDGDGVPNRNDRQNGPRGR